MFFFIAAMYVQILFCILLAPLSVSEPRHPYIRTTFAVITTKQQGHGRWDTESKLRTSMRASEPNANPLLKLIVSGPPCSGKGTLCNLLAEKKRLVHISSGDLLRETGDSDNELGRQIQLFIARGELVPDHLVVRLVITRILQADCANSGWLLDGFPRTLVQAEALERANISPDYFVVLDTSQDTVLDRVSNRRVDPVTGKIYNLRSNPPPDDELIRKRLIRRVDDEIQTMRERMALYSAQASRLNEFYTHKLIKIRGDLSPKETLVVACNVLDQN